MYAPHAKDGSRSAGRALTLNHYQPVARALTLSHSRLAAQPVQPGRRSS